MSSYIDVCEKAARAGGEVLLAWKDRVTAREKNPRDLVTEADIASQAEIRRLILDAFPDHGFLGEEGNPAQPAVAGGYRWLVDPLDGTVNYVHGLPGYAVSVALQL